MNEKFSDILARLTQRASFCASVTTPYNDLSIRLKGFPTKNEKLPWPLSVRSAKALIKLAKPAKFGWKDQTLLDISVRNVWEIPASKIRIDKRRWNQTFMPLLENIQQGLGITEQFRLSAHLHNLLVYEPGQFFQAHQDSEKLPDMVATLVVILPSAYRGGSLIVDHHGEQKQFRKRNGDDKLMVIGFYADCHHHIKPVSEGYRVVLTYNLVLQERRSSSPRLPPVKNIPSPTKNISTQTQLAVALGDYFSNQLKPDSRSLPVEDLVTTDPTRVKKWVYLLDHQYTQKSLRWNRLKNSDQLRVDVLSEIAKQQGLEAHLALADIQEVWDCEVDDSDWNSCYWQNDWEYNEKEDVLEAPARQSDYTLGNLIDNRIVLQHWIDENNRAFAGEGLWVRDSEICWTKASDEFKPFESEYEGYMGNYGNTLDRWYHRAAIVLWSQSDHYRILCELDPRQMVEELLQQCKSSEALPAIRQVVKNLLPQWRDAAPRDTKSSLSRLAFKIALALQCNALAQALLQPLGFAALTPATAKELLRCNGVYPGLALHLLKSWLQAEKYPGNYGLLDSFGKIIRALLTTKNAEAKEIAKIVTWLLTHQCDVLLEKIDADDNCLTRVDLDHSTAARLSPVIDMLITCYNVGNRKIHAMVLDAVSNHPRLYSVKSRYALIKKIIDKFSQNDLRAWGYINFSQATLIDLDCQIEAAAREKNDWSIRMEDRCGCVDCRTLQNFFKSRSKQEIVWPLRKDRRRHLHGIIESLGVPVTHETLREGSPQKLVLRKTDALFKQEAMRRAELRKIKEKLHGLKMF